MGDGQGRRGKGRVLLEACPESEFGSDSPSDDESDEEGDIRRVAKKRSREMDLNSDDEDNEDQDNDESVDDEEVMEEDEEESVDDEEDMEEHEEESVDDEEVMEEDEEGQEVDISLDRFNQNEEVEDEERDGKHRGTIVAVTGKLASGVPDRQGGALLEAYPESEIVLHPSSEVVVDASQPLAKEFEAGKSRRDVGPRRLTKKQRRMKNDVVNINSVDSAWASSLKGPHLELMVSLKQLAEVRLESTGEESLSSCLVPAALRTIGIILEELHKERIGMQCLPQNRAPRRKEQHINPKSQHPQLESQDG